MRWRYGLLAALLATPTWGCVEMIFSMMERTARFEQQCGPVATMGAAEENRPIAYRAYEGPVVQRQEVAIVVVPAKSDSCADRNPHSPYWTPYVVSVDGRRKVFGPDRKTGKEREMNFPRNCVTCEECLRVALAPGSHTMGVGMWTWGSVAPDRKGTDIQRLVQFEARAGGLYGIYVCQPGPQTQPLFWVRDEATRACVSAACPG
jgi:hypothetical protein